MNSLIHRHTRVGGPPCGLSDSVLVALASRLRGNDSVVREWQRARVGSVLWVIPPSKTQHQLHGPDEGVGEDSVAEVADGYVAVADGIQVAEQVDGDGEFKLHDFAF